MHALYYYLTKLFNIAADVCMLLAETHIKTSPLRPTLQ